MEIAISTSTNPDDYEILIRKRGEGKYASYCPQLNVMITGGAHIEVQDLMEEHINNHLSNLKFNQNKKED